MSVIWVRKLGGNPAADFKIQITSEILVVDDVRTQVNNSYQLTKCPELFGRGAALFYSTDPPTAESLLSARDSLRNSDTSLKWDQLFFSEPTDGVESEHVSTQLSTATRNQVAGIKVVGTYCFPHFNNNRSSQSVFMAAWEGSEDTVDWKPCILKISNLGEVLNVQLLRNCVPDLPGCNMVDAKPWWSKLPFRQTTGVTMPRYVSVLSEFTCKHLKFGTNLVLKHVLQVSAAIRTLHSSGLIHMDVKPSNVFLDGNCDAYLGDFGSLVRENESINSWSPCYTIVEFGLVTATRVHDWAALLISGLQLSNKLRITGEQHTAVSISNIVERMRGDRDECHVELVRIYDDHIAAHV